MIRLITEKKSPLIRFFDMSSQRLNIRFLIKFFFLFFLFF